MASLAGICLIVFTITWVGTSALGAAGVPTWSTAFELDGDPENEGLAGTDWNTLYDNGGPGGGLPYSFDTDDAPDTIFTTGGSKDEKDISDWRYREGSPPDKDDITNAFATAFTYDADSVPATANDLIVSFGLDRVDTSGDANVGFWFLQEDLPDTLTGGTFGTNVHHKVGDVLVLSSFSNGGDVPNISVYEWVLPADEDPGLDNLAALYSDNAQAKCGADDTAKACGIVNESELSGDDGPSWPYQNKDGDAEGTYQTSAFFEGAVNLTQLFAGTSQAGTTPCFSSFVAETRSSTSVTATLKDFTQDSFELCSSNVSIAPDATNGITEKHTFTISATQQVLGGAATPATNGHADVTLASSNSAATITVDNANTTCHVVTSFAAHTPLTDNLSDGGAGNPPAGTCKVVFSSDKPTTVTANAKVTIDLGGGSTTTAQTTTATDGVKVFVDGTLRWLKHDQDGVLLGGATFEVCRTADWVSSGTGTGGSFVDIVDGPDPDSDPDYVCVSVTDNSAPDDDPTAGEFQLNGLLLGKYTIRETVAPPGYAKDNDTEGPFSLSTTSTNGGTLTTSPIFVNVAKYRLIVLSCSMADEQLIRSEVDLDGSGATTGDRKFSADSLPGALGGVTNAEKILCESVRANNDANFPNLNAGTQNPKVQLPDTTATFP